MFEAGAFFIVDEHFLVGKEDIAHVAYLLRNNNWPTPRLAMVMADGKHHRPSREKEVVFRAPNICFGRWNVIKDDHDDILAGHALCMQRRQQRNKTRR